MRSWSLCHTLGDHKTKSVSRPEAHLEAGRSHQPKNGHPLTCTLDLKLTNSKSNYFWSNTLHTLTVTISFQGHRHNCQWLFLEKLHPLAVHLTIPCPNGKNARNTSTSIMERSNKLHNQRANLVKTLTNLFATQSEMKIKQPHRITQWKKKLRFPQFSARLVCLSGMKW